MKKYLFLLVLLCGIAQAQYSASNWAQKILLGTKFTTTDSLRLFSDSLRDTVLADTLYSGVLAIKDDSEGINSVQAWLDNVGGNTDSVKVDMRLVDVIKYTDSNGRKQQTVKFGEWRNVFNLITAAAENDTSFNSTDASWWMPRSGRQYRVYDISVTTDTSLVTLTDYLR